MMTHEEDTAVRAVSPPSVYHHRSILGTSLDASEEVLFSPRQIRLQRGGEGGMQGMAEISSIELGLIGCIKSCLDATARKLQANGIMGNKDWTHDCLNALVKLGRKIGYGVCPEPEIMKGEWLYDLIWYTEEESEWPNRVTDVVLAIESEWSQKLSDIRYDFQKLVQAKSRLKMLISNKLSPDDLKRLKYDIECFQRKDESEIYIFAMWVGGDIPFAYETYRSGCINN